MKEVGLGRRGWAKMQSQPSPKAKMQNLQASLMEIFEHGMALEHYLERGRGYRVFVLQIDPSLDTGFLKRRSCECWGLEKWPSQ